MAIGKIQPVKLHFTPYMGQDHGASREIQALVVGDIAIHRHAFLNPDGSLLLSKHGWTVSHVPTGDRIASALPARLAKASRADLAAWAQAWQAACPAFFGALHKGDRNAGRALVHTARKAGLSL